ncbi:MAG: DinB family protein [Candidatus Rokubacteria bacterium]|nr:DinB family protein [Candidatus Rokubacteria bacterium]
MRFSYYARLTPAQQRVYRKSDERTQIGLPRAPELHPLVRELQAALESEERAATQRATERLIAGLTGALRIPRVRVEVLAARPHRGWGELHGLYTAEPGRPAKIQLWMRTAKQRRVVAFRTYLRTLLHEVGHHVDYTYLGLPDSYHTEGFYRRESSLFYQLVPDARSAGAPNASADVPHASPLDGAGALVRRPASEPPLSRPEMLERLERTPVALATLLRGRSSDRLSRRAAPDSWSATEVVCHLRDAEETVMVRLRTLLDMDEPPILDVGPADRWAAERQYARQHAGEAWNAFSRRRDETLEVLRALSSAQWQRAGMAPRRTRVTIEDFTRVMLRHDDNHLQQIRRALDGPP